MIQPVFFKHFSSTVLAMGLTLTSTYLPSTPTVSDYTIPAISIKKNMNFIDVFGADSGSLYVNTQEEFDVMARHDLSKTNLEQEAHRLFGVMREPTEQELLSVDNYIKSISFAAGANFFDIC